MKDISQKSIKQFIAEAKMIDGAENAVFELSEEIGNCLVLTGEIQGKTHKKKSMSSEENTVSLCQQKS